MTSILILVIAMCLLFDFVNGWNDSANAIATVVSTRVLSPSTALIYAAVLNFLGALVSTRVAKTIGGGLVDPHLVTQPVIFAAMLAATLWVAICTIKGLPISGSHSLIGGLVGAAAGSFGVQSVKFSGLVKVLIALVASPLLGFIIGYILLIIVYWSAYAMSVKTTRKTFSALQVLSAGFMAFTHGTNDAQKVMGVITLALFASGKITEIVVPFWVMLSCATVMGLGTAVGGWKVIKTLGTRLSHLRPIEGFAAETAGSIVLVVAASLGVPVSTTHTITGSILGVGSAHNLRSVKWGVGQKILYAWVLTLPVSAGLGLILAQVANSIFPA